MQLLLAQMTSNTSSRFSKPCPACGRVIHPSEIPLGDSFPCPSCGEWLTYDNRYSIAIWTGSILGAIVIAFHLGYRDANFVLVATFVTWVLGLLGLFILGLVVSLPLKLVKGKPFDRTASLHLTDKSESDKNPNP